MGATRSAITVTRLLVPTIQLRITIRFAFLIEITLTLRRCLSGVNRPDAKDAKAAQSEQFSSRHIRANPCPQLLSL
jgi:hypothetical protein